MCIFMLFYFVDYKFLLSLHRNQYTKAKYYEKESNETSF